MKRLICIFTLALGFMAISATQAHALPVTTLSFHCITQNSPANCATAEAQLKLDVMDLGANQLGLLAYNLGSQPISWTDYYHDDEFDLVEFVSITNGLGVAYSSGCNPANPPGANGFTIGYCADSDAPVQPKGVGPLEEVLFKFDFSPGVTYGSFLLDLAQGRFRVAGHAQGIGTSGGSESFINDIPNLTVPEPAMIFLFAVILIGSSRRIARQKTP
jgi:hypothetical protein